ncbi:MAG: hydrogenase formation protein HypD [Desulfobacteraceae bacterium 4572_130]|nr:MAG: hydrogenase formation protein HypD [Desulfobacteraceae bacterium 4572_130]
MYEQHITKQYRNKDISQKLINKIKNISTKKISLMEVCGTHTMSIFRHGIRSVLPENITLLSGPGCPVCVTSQKDIDIFIKLSTLKNVIITTFGDLIKVLGSSSSLEKEKAKGKDIRIVYSVFDALEIAENNKHKQVVFCSVGFETTTPTIACCILMAQKRKISNFSIHSSNKITPPALLALMKIKKINVNGFILPGHVSVITGANAFKPVFEKYNISCVIAGFEPVDILESILMLVQQNELKTPLFKNAYKRVVDFNGNLKAKKIMNQVFERTHANWRGLGVIHKSGMNLKKEFNEFNALTRFQISVLEKKEPKQCICGEILMGLKTPKDCILYKKKCTPFDPVGPCMVSTEGACAAFYKYNN